MGWPSWEAMLVFAGGVITTLLTVGARRGGDIAGARKADKEGEASLSTATIAWAKHLQETLNSQIKQLREEYEQKQGEMQERLLKLEAENRIYRAHNRVLIIQLVQAGITPADLPHPEDDE
jgi:hypothetical protein